MALSGETEKFVYLKEPASGVLKLSIDKARCVMFAFSQKLEIEVFFNQVESNSCQIEKRCGGGEQEWCNLGPKSNSNSSVVEVAGPSSTHSDKKLSSETETDNGLITNDDNSSGSVTRSKTLKRVAQQRKNNHSGEKLSKEAETEISLISVNEISSGHAVCFETLDRVGQKTRNHTRKVQTDAKINSVPWIHIKANVPTKTGKKAKDTSLKKKMNLKKTISLLQTSRNKSSSANIKLTNKAAKNIIKKSHLKKLKKRQTICNVSCPFCLSEFQNQQDFYDHTKTPRVNTFQCKDCPKRFPFEAFLQAHTQVRHSETGRDNESEGYECDFCGNKSTTFFCFKKHLMFHTEEYFYKCCICGKPFVELGTLKSHMYTHSCGGMIRCKCCSQLFATRGALARHKLALTTVKCHLCGEDFPNKTSRTQHYKQFHQSDILKCVKCTGLFSSQEDMAAHMKKHAMYKKKQCTICGKFFSRLEKHIVTHKSKSELEESSLLVCDKCPRKFSDRSTFQRHLTIHSSDKPYLCPSCPRTFKDCGMLRRHLKRHSSYMPYQCDVCGKKCKESGNLKVHMRIHSETKHYPCPICPQAFNYKSSLDGHMKNKHPSNKGSSDQVSIQWSDYPHVYNSTLAQAFIPGQACVPVAQHVDISFITEEHSDASSCLQHQLGKQQ